MRAPLIAHTTTHARVDVYVYVCWCVGVCESVFARALVQNATLSLVPPYALLYTPMHPIHR